MNNCSVNIRFIFWWLQRTFSGDWSFNFYKYSFEHWRQSVTKPIEIHDFDLSFLPDWFKMTLMISFWCICVTSPVWVTWVVLAGCCLFIF